MAGVITTAVAALKGGINADPLAVDVNPVPGVAAESFVAGEILHVSNAHDDLSRNADSATHRRGQHSKFRAIALPTGRHLGRGGIADRQALVVDVISDKRLNTTYGLSGIFGFAGNFGGWEASSVDSCRRSFY